MEALHLAKWYAREHVLLCLVPAFFIAGAIGVFVSQASVMKYLGAKANKVLAYGVAAVSGTILAVCSCTVLPLFAGIWRMGAGLGPAIGVPLLRAGHQRAGDHPDGPHPRAGAGHRPGRRGDQLQRRHRPGHALDLPQGRAGRRPTARWPCPSRRSRGRCGRTPRSSRSWSASWSSPTGARRTIGTSRRPMAQSFAAAVVKAAGDRRRDAAMLLKVIDGPDAGKQTQIVPASRLPRRRPCPASWTTIWQNKWLVTAGFAAALGLILVFWFGLTWWKVLLAAVPPAVLALVLPMQGLWS